MVMNPNKPQLKENESVVFNYSNIVLTEPMERFLNRGLNFSILPKKMDLTQVYVHFKRFKRSAIWTEFFFGRNAEDTKSPIFKTTKTNLPKNYQVPDGLKKFLASVESEMQDPRNRNSVDCNIPDDEIEALKELVRLQKERNSSMDTHITVQLVH